MSSQAELEASSSSKHSTATDVVVFATDSEAHLGVQTVEATNQVYGRYSRWFLFLGLGLSSYIYSLDSQTTWAYLAFAASDLGHHSLISSIQTAQSIIIAVGKPVVAKMADVGSRGTAYAIVLVSYVVGYIVIASAKNIQTVAGGIILYALGYTGLQLLTQIIIADITTLKWRGLVSSLMSMPFIVNAFVGSNVSTSVIEHVGWRWGYGMFAILIPVSLSPLIITLLWAEQKVKKLGLVPKKQPSTQTIFARIQKFGSDLDLIGLLLLGTSVALILLPLTLAATANHGWKNSSMIAMLVIGFVVIPIFLLWEIKFAKHPVIPARFCVNRSIVIASLIGFFDFISFYLTFTYLYSFVIIVKPWPLINATYFTQTQSVGLTFFGICAGIFLRFSNRYRNLLVVGLAIRLLGVGLMIHSRGANASDTEVVWTQILQGLGGGFAAVASQVGAQASVPHIDVAMATAVVLLITEIGGAIGNAVAGAIWTNTMPGKLAHYLPDVSQADRDALYSSITTAASYPRGNPIREGVISAYSDVMRTMLIVAVVMSVFPFLLSIFMPNWYLGDTQNAVNNQDLAGTIAGAEAEEHPADRKVPVSV
ncbi:drug:h+ antiporter [Mycena floridula]|nr:drug:h+ antiporter [Mycena floridula]